MIIFEIENHKTNAKAHIYAHDKTDLHDNLIKLGYHCMVKYDLYCGVTDEGHEISVMEAHINHVSKVLIVNNEKTENELITH